MPNGMDEVFVMGVSARTGRPLLSITPEAVSYLKEQQRAPDPKRVVLENRLTSDGSASRGVVRCS